MIKPEFFYQVSGRMFRTVANELNLVEVNEIFRNENPITAREQAFNYYQDYIDVLLQSKGKSYFSHEETEKELQDFFNSYKKKYFKIAGESIDDMEIDVDSDKGLGISLVIENSKSFVNGAGHTLYEDSHLIHYIDNLFTNNREYVLKALLFEYSLYEKYNYRCKNYKIKYDVAEIFQDPVMKTILRTPMYNEWD